MNSKSSPMLASRSLKIARPTSRP